MFELAFRSVVKFVAYGVWLTGLQVQGWPMWRLAATEER